MNLALTVALIAAASAVTSAVISGIIGTTLGSYLQRRSTEHQISYSRLHERRADVVEALYKHAVAVKRAMPVWAAPGDADDLNERLGVLIEKQGDMARYFEDHRLWLDEGTRQRVDAFVHSITDLAYDSGNLALYGDMNEYADIDSDELRRRAKEDPEFAATFAERFDTSMEERKKIMRALDDLIDGLMAEFGRLLRGERPNAKRWHRTPLRSLERHPRQGRELDREPDEPGRDPDTN